MEISDSFLAELKLLLKLKISFIIITILVLMIFYWNFVLFIGRVIVKTPFHFPKNWQYLFAQN